MKREQAELDARLDKEIAAMRSPVADDGLWARIEAALVREMERTAETAAEAAAVPPGTRAPGRSRLDALGAFFRRRRWVLVPAAAALILAVVVGIAVSRRPAAPSGLLAGRALAEVERIEKDHLAAIESLERQVRPKLASSLTEESALYEDRLAVIDAQIDRCRLVLASNPANAHVRRYLLAALRDKRQTLSDALGPTE
ncbi:MAG: hypothetical protein KA243_02080 [Candidatus Aminicenantes bacterium]|nr:hypothetical protein [Candidatus Aminicenantes bacterium]NLH77885.1 hypothetical protein [Acidobacteriota bacterium]